MSDERAQRRPNGTFAPGHKGGPGRPPDTAIGKLRRLMDDTITEDEFRRVLRTLLDMALTDRHYKAASLLIAYRYGRPPQGEAMSKIEREAQELIGEEAIDALRSELNRERWERSRAEVDKLHGRQS